MDDITKSTYDKYAQGYERRTKEYLDKYLLKDAELFLHSLKGKRILDLGSGPGRDALFFKQRGFYPVCVDISKPMADLCKQKGLEAYEMDMENLIFENSSFDGIWAYTSLLHLPKNRIGKMLGKIKKLLKTNGFFYIGMKEGNSEGLVKSEKYGGRRRYFALYEKEELEKILLKHFKIVHFSRVEPDPEHAFINFLCKKEESPA